MKNMLKKLLSSVCLTILLTPLVGCDHKDIGIGVDDLLEGRIKVVYDWRYCPDANPSSMELCLYPKDGSEHLSFNLVGREGSYVSLEPDTYDIISMNNDDLDWAVYRNTDNKDDFKVETHDASESSDYNLLVNYLRSTRANDTNRLASTPGMSWSTRQDSVTVIKSDQDQVITLYPKEIVCHYSVEVRNVENIELARGITINGTISGLADGYHHGARISSDTPVTMPFTFSVDTENKELHSQFLTFGECNTVKSFHNLKVYLFLADGTTFEKAFDVDKQISEAPDPTHVNIIVSGLTIPRHGGQGGINPDVNDWNSDIIDIEM